MASPLPTKPQRTVLDNQLSFKRLDTISEIVKEAIKWAALVVIAFLGYLSVEALAGKYTTANLGVGLVGNLTVSRGHHSSIGW